MCPFGCSRESYVKLYHNKIMATSARNIQQQLGYLALGMANWVFVFADGACGRAGACKGRQRGCYSEDMCVYL